VGTQREERVVRTGVGEEVVKRRLCVTTCTYGLHTYQITKKSKETEKITIKNILQKNEYNTNLLDISISQPQKQNMHEEPKHQKTKRATFTYCGKEVRQITKLFKNTQIRKKKHKLEQRFVQKTQLATY
jgi:hypothetical protein